MKEIEFAPTNYDSDVTDAEWEIISEYFPLWNSSEYHKRSLVNAVFYIDKKRADHGDICRKTARRMAQYGVFTDGRG
jgi:hypothetical protein